MSAAVTAGGDSAAAGGDESSVFAALTVDVPAALDVLPEDVLEVLVRTMAAQPRKPTALVALTSTCHSLFALRPSRVRQDAARDTVAHSLGTRPSTSELHRQGIIKGSPGMSPKLVETRETLRREMTKNSMQQSLERRPTAEELHQKGIIKNRVAAACEALRRSFASDLVSQTLGSRPSPHELESKGIYRSRAPSGNCRQGA